MPTLGPKDLTKRTATNRVEYHTVAAQRIDRDTHFSHRRGVEPVEQEHCVRTTRLER
jgi:hypothetical protein